MVHCPDHFSQLETLETAFLRLRKYGVKLNVAKLAVGAREVTYLGYREGISLGEAKLRAVSDSPVPSSVKQIPEFKGLANYFRFLNPNNALHAGIMISLTKKNSCYDNGPLPKYENSAFFVFNKQIVQISSSGSS